MEDGDCRDIEMEAINTIRLYPSDNVLFNVMDEDSVSVIWKKLEKLYMKKSITNKLYLKRQLYGLKDGKRCKLFRTLKCVQLALGSTAQS